MTPASEPQRRRGYRKVGGLYLVSDPGSSAPCDRLPMPIVPCPCCGEQPRFHRSIAMIDPFVLWGNHLDLATGRRCSETDAMCAPADKGFLMWVGNEYTVENFQEEADRLGVSKRIPAIPRDIEVGVDWVYLAKRQIIPESAQMWLPGQVQEKAGYGPGVFEAFQPARIEKIVADLTPADEMAGLEAQGITPVVVPHDSPCHAQKRGNQAALPPGAGE